MAELTLADFLSPFNTPEYLASARERIASRTIQLDGGCLECSLGIMSKGYSTVSFGRKMWRTHRLVWEMEKGPIPEGMTLDHTCENKRCINTGHLAVVSADENMARYHQRRKADGFYPPQDRTWRPNRPKAALCTSGHDLTLDGARTKNGRCRTCFNEMRRTPEHRAKHAAYAREWKKRRQ